MRAFLPLLKRELSRMIHSSVVTIIVVLFLVMLGGMFFRDFFDTVQPLSLRGFFSQAPILLAFFCPALTMGRIAGERADHTLDLLLTMPLHSWHIVMAKFVACLVVLAFVLLCTLAYPLTLSELGTLDWGPVWGGYIALFMLGGGYCAIGLLTSAWAKDQMIAVLTAFFLCVALTYIDLLADASSGNWALVLQSLSASHHFSNIARGVIDIRDIFYTLSLQCLALCGAVFTLEARRYPDPVVES